MSTVDGTYKIDSYEELPDEILFKENNLPIFSIKKTNPKVRLKYLIPFEMVYCYDCTLKKYVHQSFKPL